MALQPTDLFVVQQGAVVKSVDYATLSAGVNSQTQPTDLPIATAATLGAIRVGENLVIDSNTGVLNVTLPSTISYQGNINPTEPAPSATAGEAYIVSNDGVFDATFQNIAGITGNIGDVCVYSGETGDEWDIISGLFGVGVIHVKGTAPIIVDSSDASNPVISISPATDKDAGSLSASDKEKLDGIQDGADIGTVTKVTASLPLEVLNGETEPVISIKPATTAAVGVVRLADSTAIANGTSERVVDASQLKTVNDKIIALELTVDDLSLYNFLGDDPITVSVDSSDNVTYSVKDASDSQKGVTRFATGTEAENGVDTDKAMSPFQVKSFYLTNDFTNLASV